MPSLKEVRIRIASVKSTQQITSAMKMVAASKLRRAQNAIIKLRPYVSKLSELMQNLGANPESAANSPYTSQRSLQEVLLVVITSNRGLCGAFNSNVLRTTVNHINTHYAQLQASGHVSLITIGRKGSEFFTKRNYKVIASHDAIFDNLTYDQAAAISSVVMGGFVGKQFDRVEIIYNQFRNAATQKLVVEQFLPIAPPQVDEKQGGRKTDYIFLPSQDEIITELIPKTLKTQFYKTILDSYASEHGARMTAMHQATDNASQLIKELNLMYNKARQAAITKEILEIVSGAEALKNQ